MSKYTGVNLLNQIESTLEKVCGVLESLDSYVIITKDATTGLTSIKINKPNFSQDLAQLSYLIKKFNQEVGE